MATGDASGLTGHEVVALSFDAVSWRRSFVSSLNNSISKNNRGGDKLLYRGESAENYKRGTYGLSWTPIKSVAVGFAGGDPLHKIARCTKGGTVLLRARVPQAAIIAKMQKSYDYYQEQEYLVDRRFLKGVFAAKSFPEYTGKLTAVVRFPSANDLKRARAILRRKAAA